VEELMMIPSHAVRIGQLDGLRALAILAVFFHHAGHVPLLWMGVDMFFVLSGFLITGILLRLKAENQSHFFTFYSRRIRRILPPYIVFIALGSLCFVVKWRECWYWYAFFGANIAEVLHRGAGVAFTPLWSLAVEEQFYFVWPVLILLASERNIRRICWLLLILVPISRALVTPFTSSHFFVYFLTPFRMDLLCAGSLVALAWRRDPTRFSRWRTSAMLVGVAAGLGIAVLSRLPQFRTSANSILFNSVGYSLSVVFFSAVLMVSLGLNARGLISRFLNSPGLRYIGQISYSMYLVHMAMIILTSSLTTNLSLRIGLALALTIVYSALSWQFMESRFLGPTYSTNMTRELADGSNGRLPVRAS
jgi:peptidoglycan/LPS O-acetylase OafA/YrhL